MTYNTIKKTFETEYVISKSRFLAAAFPVQNTEQILEVLAGLRKQHPFATHICFAYQVREDGHVLLEKSSDDGEPKGTAGVPILEVIKRSAVSNILVTVVRYFGGVKLGAGGLVRAYSHAASLALGGAERVTMGLASVVECKLSFASAARIHALQKGQELSRAYGGEVVLRIATRDLQGLASELAFLTGGEVGLDNLGEEWIEIL